MTPAPSIPPVESWADQVDKEARSRELARERKQEILLYHRVFDNQDGLKVLAHLAEHFQTELPAYAQMSGAYDPYRGCVCEGQRSILLYIRSMLLKRPIADANEPEDKPNVIR
jgi:hypothetical protein